ncbi:PQQ-dependent sugar dehydrogenase, partial [Escherichia coli]
LLDVALDPDYAAQPWVYWSYSEAGSGTEAQLSGTAVARGQIQGQRMTRVEVLYRQAPKVEGSGNYGSRLVFARDKTLFVTLGE